MDEAFTRFATGRYPALLRLAYLLTGDTGLAEDLVQEALARTCLAWRRRAIHDPDRYVRRVMVNTNVTLWRRRRREELREDLPEPAVDDASGPLAERDRMWLLLRGVPPRQRAVLVLRFYEQLSESEIARVLDVSVGTVRSQCSRGLDRLRAALAAETAATGRRSR